MLKYMATYNFAKTGDLLLRLGTLHNLKEIIKPGTLFNVNNVPKAEPDYFTLCTTIKHTKLYKLS